MFKRTHILYTVFVVSTLALFGAGCSFRNSPTTSNPTTSTSTLVVSTTTSSDVSDADKALAHDVVGFWEGGPGSEEIDIYEDGTFSSFLHDHPFYSGTWKIDHGALVLSDSTELHRYTNITRESDGSLNMVDGESGEFLTWDPIETFSK